MPHRLKIINGRSYVSNVLDQAVDAMYKNERRTQAQRGEWDVDALAAYAYLDTSSIEKTSENHTEDDWSTYYPALVYSAKMMDWR